MTIPRRTLASAVGAAALTAAAVAGPSLATTAAQSTTISFKELNKGSKFAFVDNAPRTKIGKNGPKKISAGDMIVFTNPLADSTGKRIGQVRATCTATITTKKFEKAGFLCDGAFVLAGGTLFVKVADIGDNVTGAVTSGTGDYAGARGSFTSKSTSSGSDDVVTLLP